MYISGKLFYLLDLVNTKFQNVKRYKTGNKTSFTGSQISFDKERPTKKALEILCCISL